LARATKKKSFALVYHGGGPEDFIGIRVECSGLGKEFVSNVSFGRDPEGDLYYKDKSKLTGECRYEVEFQVGSVLSIKIFAGCDSTSSDLIAQFVGTDPASAIGWLSYDERHPEFELKGTWLDYNPLSIEGSRIICRPGSTTVTINLASIYRKVTFNLPTASPLGMDHLGIMTINGDIKSIRPGTKSYVDYNSDRVIFYPQMGSTKMTAYFIPDIVKNEDLYSLGGSEFISDGLTAVWLALS